MSTFEPFDDVARKKYTFMLKSMSQEKVRSLMEEAGYDPDDCPTDIPRSPIKTISSTRDEDDVQVENIDEEQQPDIPEQDDGGEEEEEAQEEENDDPPPVPGFLPQKFHAATEEEEQEQQQQDEEENDEDAEDEDPPPTPNEVAGKLPTPPSPARPPPPPSSRTATVPQPPPPATPSPSTPVDVSKYETLVKTGHMTMEQARAKMRVDGVDPTLLFKNGRQPITPVTPPSLSTTNSPSPRRETRLAKMASSLSVMGQSLRNLGSRITRRRKDGNGLAGGKVVTSNRRGGRKDNSVAAQQRAFLALNRGSSNLWYQLEDHLCSEYWLNDASGQRVSKMPKAGCTIVNVDVPKLGPDKATREDYLLKSKPRVHTNVEARQLIMLSANQTIQEVRNHAAGMGLQELEHASIKNIADLLRIVGFDQTWVTKFQEHDIDLATAFFLKYEHLKELDMPMGKCIRLQQILQYMRKVQVSPEQLLAMGIVNNSVPRATKFCKGDEVEHYREGDCLIRKGRVVAVHADDPAGGIYYSVLLDEKGTTEFQSGEAKLNFPGVWEKIVRAQGKEPIFVEPGGVEEDEASRVGAGNGDKDARNRQLEAAIVAEEQAMAIEQQEEEEDAAAQEEEEEGKDVEDEQGDNETQDHEIPDQPQDMEENVVLEEEAIMQEETTLEEVAEPVDVSGEEQEELPVMHRASSTSGAGSIAPLVEEEQVMDMEDDGDAAQEEEEDAPMVPEGGEEEPPTDDNVVVQEEHDAVEETEQVMAEEEGEEEEAPPPVPDEPMEEIEDVEVMSMAGSRRGSAISQVPIEEELMADDEIPPDPPEEEGGGEEEEEADAPPPVPEEEQLEEVAVMEEAEAVSVASNSSRHRQASTSSRSSGPRMSGIGDGVADHQEMLEELEEEYPAVEIMPNDDIVLTDGYDDDDDGIDDEAPPEPPGEEEEEEEDSPPPEPIGAATNGKHGAIGIGGMKRRFGEDG